MLRRKRVPSASFRDASSRGNASAGTGCTITGAGTCTFSCEAGEQVRVGARDPEAVVGTRGGSGRRLVLVGLTR